MNNQKMFLYAIHRKNSVLAFIALTADANPDAFSSGYAATHYAIFAGDTRVLKLLIDKGADVNIKATSIFHPSYPLIHLAVEKRNPSVLRMLLSASADINSTDHEGRTALMLAMRSDRISCARELLNNNPSLVARDIGGYTAMHYCAMFSDNSCESARLLNAKGVNWNVQTKSGETPLHIAAAGIPSGRMVSFLLASNANQHT